MAPLSVELLQQWADAIAEGVAVLDRQGRFLYVNRVAAAALGLQQGALVGRALSDVVDESGGGRGLLRAFGRIAQESLERASAIDVFPGPSPGQDRWVDHQLVRVGETVVCTLRDISALHRAACEREAMVARLRALEAASRAFADQVGDRALVAERLVDHVLAAMGDACAVRVRAADGRTLETLAFCQRASPGAEAVAGYMSRPVDAERGIAAELLAAGALVRIRPAQMAELRARMSDPERRAADAFAATHEGAGSAQNGESGGSALLAAPLRMGGAVVGMVTVASRRGDFSDGDAPLFVELAERASLALAAASTLADERRARALLESANERLGRWEQLFQHAGWGVAIVEPGSGRFQAVNPAFAALHGYDVDELMQRELAVTFAPEERAALQVRLAEAHAAGRLSYESTHVRKDGSRFPVVAEVVAVNDAAGRVLYLAVNLQDISERRRLSAEAEAASCAKDELLARLGRLQALASGLAEAATPNDVAEVVVARIAAAVEGRSAGFAIVTEDGALELAAVRGLNGAQLDRWRRIPGDAPLPSSEAMRTGAPVWLASRSEIDGYPAMQLEPSALRIACLPLSVDGVVLGVLSVGFAFEAPFAPEERDFLQAISSLCAHALARARAYEAERDGRQRLERLVAQALRVQELSAQLSRPLRPEQIGALAVAEGVHALGAQTVGLWVVEPDGTHARMLRSVGYGAAEAQFARVALAEDMPLAHALRSATPIFLSSRADYAAAYPQSEARARGLTTAEGMNLACLPLMLDDRVVGALALVFAEERVIGDDERRFLVILARQCAQALERWRLYAETREAAMRAQLLADATAALTRVTAAGEIFDIFIDHVAKPLAADRASFLLAYGDGALQPVVEWGVDEEAARRWPDLDAAFVADLVAEVLRAGSAVYVERRDDLAPSDGTEAPRLEAWAIVPLSVGDGATGIVTVAFAAPHPFALAERAFIESVVAQSAYALERARLHQTEAEARRAAEEASRAKDEFLAMLGHELRNPLAPIVTALQLMKLRQGAGGREQEVIERQVQHLLRLVDDLLDVSRITRGKVELKRAPVDLADVVARAVEMAGPLIEQKQHRLHVELPRGMLVDGDLERLAQVVANLLTNAARYTPPSGSLSVHGAVDDQRVVVRVRDDGVGISPELLPLVFDLFVQGRRGVDRAEGGLGLGLTLVRRLVEMHGGAVRAESEGANRGSEFIIELPALEPSTVPATVSLRAVQRLADARRRRVLLVDDNVDAVELMADALRDAGHEVVVAYDGVHALRVLDGFVPEVAVLDLGLPVMDGLELAQRLRARPELAGVRLVALTGYGQPNDRKRTRAAGFAHHLVKPTSITELLGVIGAGPG